MEENFFIFALTCALVMHDQGGMTLADDLVSVNTRVYSCSHKMQQEGHDLATLHHIHNRLACATACEQNKDGCIGFDYDNFWKNCWLSKTPRSSVPMSKAPILVILSRFSCEETYKSRHDRGVMTDVSSKCVGPVKCNSKKVCVGFEGTKVYCYGNSGGCLWRHWPWRNWNDCNTDGDCAKYSTKSPKFTDGDDLDCSFAPSGWRADACKCPKTIRPWRGDWKCGASNLLSNGQPAQCDADGKKPCCSPRGWCGATDGHCKCKGCTDYRKIFISKKKDSLIAKKLVTMIAKKLADNQIEHALSDVKKDVMVIKKLLTMKSIADNEIKKADIKDLSDVKKQADLSDVKKKADAGDESKQ